MPVVSMGGAPGFAQSPSNFTLFFQLGGRSLDVSRTAGDAVQKAIGSAMKSSGLPRSEIFLTAHIPCCPAFFAKFICDNNQSHKPEDDIAADFKLLEVDYVDLMVLHWKCDEFEDTVTHYKALEAMLERNQTRAIGVSNFDTGSLDKLLDRVRIKPAVNQIQLSIGNHNGTMPGGDLETLHRCSELGITAEAYSALGGITGIDVLHDPDVVAVARAHNKSTAQVALRWITQQGGTFITATEKASHIKDDMDIFDFDLSDAEVARLTSVGSLPFASLV